MKTRTVTKALYTNYLRKSQECLAGRRHEYEAQRWNSCAILAVHSAISAADALTVFLKGVRHAGERHEDVIVLLRTFGIKTQHLHTLLNAKNSIEYEEKLTSEQGAAFAIQNAERFYSWVKKEIPI